MGTETDYIHLKVTGEFSLQLSKYTLWPSAICFFVIVLIWLQWANILKINSIYNKKCFSIDQST